MTITDKVIVGMFVAVFIGLGWLILHAQSNWDECRSKGGRVVETVNGYVCAKLEIIK